MKTLIIYQSKYGSTKQYAEWINQAVESDITDIDNVFRFHLNNYDIIVLGTYLHASHIKMRKFIIKEWNELKNKKIILFSLSGSPAEYVIEAVKKDLPPEIIDNIKYFPLRGRSRFKSLSLFDRTVMRLGQILVYIQGKKDMARNMAKDFDYVTPDKIEVITNEIMQ